MRSGLWVLVLCGLMLVACGNEKSTNEANVTPTEGVATLNVPLLGAPNTPLALPNPLTQDDARLPLAIPTGAELAQAQTLYATHCAECHGADGAGQQPDPYTVGAAPPHNADGHTWHHPDQANFATVWNGTISFGGKMPGFAGKLSEDEIMLVLGYIKGWWQEDQLLMQNERTVYFKTAPLQ